MLLKKIEIHGFKSFADKTEFELGRGVTCLVGPNGCGKSNVVDALRWALGEQRPSALRGEEMADVVFKGNGGRPPMGFAEVTLVFDNELGQLPIETPEVAITRKLYRSGESEYQINRQIVRLRDVRELFYDTGLGHNAYAVMEQGKIDGVLRATPPERRAIFEEAAGIQKFRARKREAERKLERVDQNLLRATDLINELESRVRSLRIQAGRARSYVQLTGRLTELKTTQFLCAGAELLNRQSGLGEQIEATRVADRLSADELSSATERVETVEADVARQKDELAGIRTRQAEARAQLEADQARLTALRQRESESRHAAAERGEQARRLELEAQARQVEVDVLIDELTKHRAVLAAAEADVAARRSALLEAQAAEVERKTQVENAYRELAAGADRQLRLSNQLASLESQARGLRSSRERLVRREVELSMLLERVLADTQGIERNLDELDQQARAQSRSLQDATAELKTRREREAELHRRMAQLSGELAALESRRETLDAVIERMEGVEEGSRRLVRASRDAGGSLTGVLGLLGELVPASRDTARALDAALGSLAGAVVVEDRAALERCLEFLRAQGKGPATFLVMDRPSVKGATSSSWFSRLEMPERVRSLLEPILGHVELVAGEDGLTRVLDQLGSGRFLVTHDGARLDPTGAFVDRPAAKTLGFVERKSERDTLAGTAVHLHAELSQLAADEAKTAGEVAEWTAWVEEAEHKKRAVDAGIVESRSASARLQDRGQIFQRELSVSSRERADLEGEERQVSARRGVAEHELLVSEESRRGAEERRDQLLAAGVEAEQRVASLVQEEAVAVREVVRLGERRRGIETEIAQVRRALDEQAVLRTRLLEEQEDAAKRAAHAAADAAAAELSVTELAEERRGLQIRAEQLEGAVESAALAVGAARNVALAAARAREAAREALHALELEERELLLSHTTLRERAKEEVALDLDERLKEFDRDGAPAADQVAADLAELKDRIARIGNVNLDAITELDEVEGRLAFLTKEKLDLDDSRKALQETIVRLDEVSRARFQETFEAVRGHFKELFRKLFHGGRADIFLQEGVDILDAGVEIVAGPPGKDPRSITSLSGGERTMTAIGLLFALFKARPAPVAVLDEVDAALDESNTERFCNLLAEFLADSQFVIVTHKKRTMSYADVIFGVTIEENGVSKRIGVRLEDYEEKVA